MVLKAVFLDFDDTLVLTKLADKSALSQARQLAQENKPEVSIHLQLSTL